MKSSFSQWAFKQLPIVAKMATVLGLSVAAANLVACHQVGEMIGNVFDTSALSQPVEEPKIEQKPLIMQPTKELLSDYNWVLVKAQKQGADIHTLASVIEKGEGKLSFYDDELGYSVGCNGHSAPYQLSGDKLTMGVVIATQKACPQDLDDVESKFAERFNQSQLSVVVDADNRQATLTQTQGVEVLTWHGTMTHEARYGEPVVLFWEITPNLVDCVNRQGKSTSCLKVRNVNYDEQGVKVGSGAWRTFHGTIHGYEHKTDQKTIVRLNAYNNPDSNENPLYVFDMAVEVELIDVQ